MPIPRVAPESKEHCLKRLISLAPFLLLLSLGNWIPLAVPARAADQAFFVDTFSDSVDVSPGDHHCNDSNDRCSLRAAVQEANALTGSTSITLTDPGTYNLTIAGANEDKAARGDIDIRTGITLWAPSGGARATIKADPGFGDRVFDIPAGTPSMDVRFEPNLVITGGVAPAGQDGGGIRSVNAGSLTLNQMTVSGNTARNGGGVYVTGTAASTFTTNVADFSGNTATSNGGGMDVEGTVDASLGFLTADHNTAASGGGVALFQDAGSTGSAVTVGSGIITNNSATKSGGGMIVSRFAATMIDVLDNTADSGGGVTVIGTNGPSNIGGRSHITGNRASGKGGGVYGTCLQSCGILALTTIEDNSSGSDGGGIYLIGGLSLERSTIDANRSAGYNGGAILHMGSLPLEMTNVTVTGNSTTATGTPDSGGVVVKATVVDTFTNDTIAWNSGGSKDGVVVTGTGARSPQLKNTIVADTAVGTALCSKPLTSLGHNLDSGDTCGFTARTDMVNTDPGLNPLSDNGGGVDTLGLKTGTPSVALDAGDNVGCPATDARWVARAQDGDGNSSAVCDIGAYEFGPSFANSQVGITVTPSPTNPRPGALFTYTISFTNTGPFPTENSVATDTLPTQLTLVSCVATGTTCQIVGNTASALFPLLGLGGLPKMTVVARVGTSIPVGAVITNTAATWADNPDPNDANNVGRGTVTVS